MGAGQVKAADYFLQPDIVSANQNSGGGGARRGDRRERSAVCSVTAGAARRRDRRRNQRQEGRGQRHSVAGQRPHNRGRSADRGLFPQERFELVALGGGGGWWGGFAAAGGYGYQNTEIGQIIVLAYLDAYKKLVTQLGGFSAAPPAPPAPPAR